MKKLYKLLEKKYGKKKLEELRLAALGHHPECFDKKTFQEWLCEYVLTSTLDLFEEFGVEFK